MKALTVLFLMFPALCFGGLPFTAPQNIDLSGDNYFNGLPVYDNEAGASDILYDTVNDFLWTPSLDLTSWTGKNVRVSDGSEYSYGVVTGAGGGLSLGSELHTDANAASDPNSNEADATTGWTSFSLDGTGANVFASQSGTVNVGTYAIEANANDTPTSNARIVLDIGTAYSLVSGTLYTLTFDWRHVGTGDEWSAIFNDTNNKNTPTVTIGDVISSEVTFISESYSFTYTTDYKFLVIYESAAPADGGVYVDNLSLKAVTDGPANATITVDAWVDGGVDPNALTTIEVLDNPAVLGPDPVFYWR